MPYKCVVLGERTFRPSFHLSSAEDETFDGMQCNANDENGEHMAASDETAIVPTFRDMSLQLASLSGFRRSSQNRKRGFLCRPVSGISKQSCCARIVSSL